MRADRSKSFPCLAWLIRLSSWHRAGYSLWMWMGLWLALATVARSEFLVSSFSGNQVFRYHETTGAFIDVFIPNTNGLLNLPHGMAFGPDGNLYVASAGNDRILRYNGANGAFIDTFIPNGRGGLNYPVTMIFRPDGLLYVSSQLSDQVLRFNGTNGAFVDVFVAASSVLDGPSDMVFGPDGHLYVVGRFNDRVVRYDGINGELIDEFVDNNLLQPFGLRFTPAGELLVVSGDQNRVQRFNGDSGQFISAFNNPGGLALPVGIVYGPDENLYVASFSNNKVARFRSIDGVYLGDFVPSGSGGLRGPNFMLFRPPPVAPAPPVLGIDLSGSEVALFWATNASEFHLQSSLAVSTNSTWTAVSGEVVVSGDFNFITLPVEVGNHYFRLLNTNAPGEFLTGR